MSEVIPAPAAPAAPSALPTAAPSAPTGETPVPQAGDTPPAPPAGETPAQPDDAEKSDRARHRRQLNTAYRKAAEAAARAEFFEKQFNESRAKSPEADPAAPKLEQFKDIEDYAAAKAKHESEKAVKDLQSKQQGETQKQQQARLAEAWENQVERGSGKYDDWDEKVGEIKPTSPWSAAIMQAENGDDVAHHLGSNPKEARRISALHPFMQIFEIGRLSAKLAAEPPKPTTPSRAPAPITPLTGTAPPASDVPSEQDDMKSWMRKRQKQVHKR